MGTWSRTAPELPSGSAWEQTITKTVITGASHLSMKATYEIARLEGKQFAVKVNAVTAKGTDDFRPDWGWDKYLECKIDGVSAGVVSSGKYAQGNNIWYFVDEADAGAAITVICGSSQSAHKSNGTVTLTAPALLGNLCFVKVGGAWVKGQMKLRTGGVWSDVFAKIKAGGIWK